MTVNETQLELLETYLDAALPRDEAEAISARLIVEPALAAALDELRAQRTVRDAVWQALEPDPATADRLTWRIQGEMMAMDKSTQRRWGVWNMGRVGSVAAACLVLGFFAGWAGRSNHAAAPVTPVDQQQVAVNTSNTTPAANTNGLLVPVTNEYGQVVAWQPFRDPNDAKDFTEDLHRARTPAAAPADVRLAADEKVKF